MPCRLEVHARWCSTCRLSLEWGLRLAFSGNRVAEELELDLIRVGVVGIVGEQGPLEPLGVIASATAASASGSPLYRVNGSARQAKLGHASMSVPVLLERTPDCKSRLRERRVCAGNAGEPERNAGCEQSPDRT